MDCRRLAWASGVLLNLACADEAQRTSASGSVSGDTTGPDGSSSVGDPDATDPTEPASASTADSADGSSSGMTTDASDTSGDADASTGEPAVCPAPPTCDTPLPNPGPLVDWNDGASSVVTNAGGANHRGRDMFYNPGDAQWVLAKFAYGINDWDLEGERIDMYLLRGCSGEWESLGSVDTTYEGTHATIEGVDDTGGRLYFLIPQSKKLGVGRHRIHMFVRGDGTETDMFIEVVDPGTPMFVTDVDGTLTTSETEEFTALLTGVLPDVNPSAPEALWALVDLGYRPMYLTARPEFLGERTREFITERGLPPGNMHTTLSFTGALGGAAVTYKSAEMAALADRGLVPDWAFGNTSSDADAYESGGISPLDHRIFFQYDDAHGGRRIDDYGDLLPEFAALEPVCEP